MTELIRLIDAMQDLISQPPPWERMPVVRTGERAPISPAVRLGVWLRDSGRCRWCGCAERGQMVLDHIVPWSAGGSDRSDNLRVLCWDCNDRRSNFQTDAAMARVTPVSYACSRCAGRWLDRSYDLTVEDEDIAVYDAPRRVVEFTDPVAAFCVRCRFAGTAERGWTL
jgi:hypothetical protein